MKMNLSRLIAAIALGSALLGPAMAQTEPTIDQVYQAAKAGRLAEADGMIGQVLQKHPNSAKAHFVKAELAAMESNAAVARQELATAERLAPGLPFAKPQAVTALRSEVNASRRAQTNVSPAPAAGSVAPAEAPRRQFPMALVAILFALAAAGFYLFVRNRSASASSGAVPFGTPAPAGPGAYANDAGQGYGAGYGAPVYGGGAYPQPAQPGMASTLGRGLATGLAVGAGAVMAEEIGHRLFEHHQQLPPLAPATSGVLPESERGMLDPGVNADMGGQDFGIDDAGSWDNGGDADVAGGDWDN
jgi:uncharacterized protein